MTEGAVSWNATYDDHPARVASRRSIEMVAARDKEGWLALYSDDALIEDPVGPSPFDPRGTGLRGQDRLSAYWDGTIATTERLDFEINHSYAAGCEVANVGSIAVYLPNNVRLQTNG